MHTIVKSVIAIGLLAATPGITAAQSTTNSTSRWEFIAGSGTIIPTGEQRDPIKRGGMSTAQLSYLVQPFAAINATAGWARSRDITTVGDPKLDIFTYDVGMDVRA